MKVIAHILVDLREILLAVLIAGLLLLARIVRGIISTIAADCF